jgi:hypothetical protein
MPKATRMLPPAEYLHECFYYDHISGELRWRKRPQKHFRSHYGFATFNARWPGHLVGSPERFGNLQTSVDGIKFKVARIIWKMHYGTDPMLIDHINRNPRDNRIINLRSVNDQQNRLNTIRVGSFGLTGVSRNGKRFKASIKNGNKLRHLGTFDSPEEAHAVYRKAAKELYGEFDPFR